jgi:hypothetical protein
MMHKNLWNIVLGTEKVPKNSKQLIEWEKREERAKSTLGPKIPNN